MKTLILTVGSQPTPYSRGERDLHDAESLVGSSEWATTMRAHIGRVAPHGSSVMITGPSGTGKELIARAIHRQSARAERPFIAVDCAAVTGPLFASHLFGHVKGAFTDAGQSTLGCFRAAQGGTVLLDEIGELDCELQAKLLRVLQERVVNPVGTHEPIPIDVRVIAATNRDLETLVATGRFREDLYYRLNVVALKTVPLKDRPEDIGPLARHILTKLASRLKLPVKELSTHCLACLRKHDWPGNVRELENFLERSLLLSPQAMIPRGNGEADCLCICPAAGFHRKSPPAAQESKRECAFSPSQDRSAPSPDSSRLWPTLADVERQHIERTLKQTGYNQQAAAELLGIHRQQLLRKVKKHALIIPPSRRGRPRTAIASEKM